MIHRRNAIAQPNIHKQATHRDDSWPEQQLFALFRFTVVLCLGRLCGLNLSFFFEEQLNHGIAVGPTFEGATAPFTTGSACVFVTKRTLKRLQIEKFA